MAARGSSAWRKQYWPSCEKADTVAREFGPQRIKLRVAKVAVEAYEALFDVLALHGYVVRQQTTGAYNCRKITGGTVPSAHASGIAVDINWDTNPYTTKLVTDFPANVVAAVMAITTKNGLTVWRWGGDWDNRPDTTHAHYDAMHWELMVTPDELTIGIDRHIQNPDVIALHPVLRKGSQGPAVVQLQQLLTREGYPLPMSGNFLDQTNKAVRKYQSDHGLKVDGVVGAATWTSLYNNLPVIQPGSIRPNKTSVIAA